MPHESKIIPFICRRCKNEVARTDDVDIWFGIQKSPGNPLHLLFTCIFCKAEIRWKSNRGGNLLTENRKV